MKCSRRGFALASAGIVAVGLGARAPSARAQETPANLFLYGDTVEGGKNRPEDSDRRCVLANVFPRNSQIVWRMRAIDMALGGVALDDTVVDTVVVTLQDKTEVSLKYGGHPPDEDTDFFWSSAWLIPKDYPTGTLLYSVLATAKDGRTAEYKPFDISSSLITITEEVLEDIVTES
jgi:hypothetical protein